MGLTVVARHSHQPTRRVFLHIYMYIPILLFNKLSGGFNDALVFLYSFLQPADNFYFCLLAAHLISSPDIFCIRWSTVCYATNGKQIILTDVHPSSDQYVCV